MEPAAISAKPAVKTMRDEAIAPVRPAASANGTVNPSAMPITMSRTVLLAVKCFSMCGVWGIKLKYASGHRFIREENRTTKKTDHFHDPAAKANLIMPCPD